MSYLFAVGLLTFMVLSTSNANVQGQTNKPCQRNSEYYTHESECDLFYKCDNHELTLFQCYPGLHWNDEDNVCDFPFLAKCKYSICEKSSPAPICPGWNKLTPISYLAHQNDCSMYYRCERGVAYLMDCERDLHFNPNTWQCEDASYAGCICHELEDEFFN